jgi:protein-disulfide isomerase
LRLELRLVVSVLLSVAVAQTPVPSRPTGYIYQSPSSPKIVVEAFYDLLCVDSKANWPVLKEVFRQFSDEDLEGIIHMFPLPYHHNAYFMQQASVVVRQTDPSQFIKMMELIFQQQDSEYIIL